MSRYTAWIKRKENATPYANTAVCKKCKYGKWIRTSAFCSGRERIRKLTSKEWEDENPGFCPEFIPRDEVTE